MDGILLQTLEGLGNAPLVTNGSEIWERLQGEKEIVAQEILSDGPLCQATPSGVEELASEESGREIEWHRRGQLEARLRELNEAQDRLLDGAYGCCSDCGEQIDRRRLALDPATPLCLSCQKNGEHESVSFAL